MQDQIRLILDACDIVALAKGRVIYKDKNGRPLGTGDTFTAGEHPIEICLTEGDRAVFRGVLGIVDTSGD